MEDIIELSIFELSNKNENKKNLRFVNIVTLNSLWYNALEQNNEKNFKKFLVAARDHRKILNEKIKSCKNEEEKKKLESELEALKQNISRANKIITDLRHENPEVERENVRTNDNKSDDNALEQVEELTQAEEVLDAEEEEDRMEKEKQNDPLNPNDEGADDDGQGVPVLGPDIGREVNGQNAQSEEKNENDHDLHQAGEEPEEMPLNQNARISSGTQSEESLDAGENGAKKEERNDELEAVDNNDQAGQRLKTTKNVRKIRECLALGFTYLATAGGPVACLVAGYSFFPAFGLTSLFAVASAGGFVPAILWTLGFIWLPMFLIAATVCLAKAAYDAKRLKHELALPKSLIQTSDNSTKSSTLRKETKKDSIVKKNAEGPLKVDCPNLLKEDFFLKETTSQVSKGGESLTLLAIFVAASVLIFVIFPPIGFTLLPFSALVPGYAAVAGIDCIVSFVEGFSNSGKCLKQMENENVVEDPHSAKKTQQKFPSEYLNSLNKFENQSDASNHLVRQNRAMR